MDSDRAESRIYLASARRIAKKRIKDGFPWSMRLFRELETLEFRKSVTLFVGENGCGKSTLLEGLAVGTDAVAAGSADLSQDETLWAAHEFARNFLFARIHKPARNMFLRAEDVFGYTLNAARLQKDERKSLEQLDQERIVEQSTPRAGSPVYLRERLLQEYGGDPVSQSHGETFLELLGNRLHPRGLYFLDEPETPLSPTRVLALLALIIDRTSQGCQFVIATHSPILMAVPDAEILLFEERKIVPVPYEEVEHVKLTKAFLNNPAKFLRHF